MEGAISRILITGGAGFVGAHLCRRLAASGHDIVILDDLSSGRLSNIADLLAGRRVTLHNRDVTELSDIQADQIYHLACPASPVFYMRDPIATWRTITMGTAAVLDAARRWRARALLASTSEIYGEPEIHPQHEQYFGNVDATSPRSCYAEGKRAAETLASAHTHQGLDVRIARLFNVYGPGMRHDDGRVVASFIRAALLGEDLVVQGDGRQTRSFCHIDDLVDGLVRLMEHEAVVTGPVNLGNPQEVTIAELAHLVRHLTGSCSSLRFENARESDPSRRRPDIRKAYMLLGWGPVVPLRDGLANTVASFKAELRRLPH